MVELRARIGRRTLREDISTRISKVQNWLLDKQLDDHSWHGSPWHTAKVIIGLVDTGIDPDHPKLIRAYEWLVRVADETRPREVNWEGWTWDTALVVRAIQRLDVPNKQEYVSRAMTWLKREEERSIAEGTPALYFGRCYTAQVILAMGETDDGDSELLDFFVDFLKSQQERNGSWVNSFDTAQIIEALVAANVHREAPNWVVERNGLRYKGGIDRAVEWIEVHQTVFGNWDGLTWPTAWLLRAYLLAARKYNPRVAKYGLGWLFSQCSGTNDSWFHEQARSASAIKTLQVALDRLSPSSGINLDVPQSQFFISVPEDKRWKERTARLTDEYLLREELRTAKAKLALWRRGVLIACGLIGMAVSVAVAVWAYFHAYDVVVYVSALSAFAALMVALFPVVRR